MRRAWYLFALLTIARTGQLWGQTAANAPQRTPPASLVRLDAASAEILYHTRDDQLVVLQFIVTEATQRSTVKEKDTVLVSYVDRGSQHIAQSIYPYITVWRGGASSRPGGGVSMNTQPPAFAPNSRPAFDSAEYGSPTAYSREGAEALQSEFEALLENSSRIETGSSGSGPSYALVTLKRSGLAVSLNSDKCATTNVWESGKLHHSSYCPGPMGAIVAGVPVMSRNRTLKKGDLVAVRDLSVGPDGLSFALSYASLNYGADKHAYPSVLRLPFSEGELPTPLDLQVRLFDIIGLAPPIQDRQNVPLPPQP